VASALDRGRRLAAAVHEGGMLLIAGHHLASFRSSDVTTVLDDGWDIEIADDDVPHRVTAHDGQAITGRSAVIRARRRPG
jgi:hypothetical protein